jgi:hypothetical protein
MDPIQIVDAYFLSTSPIVKSCKESAAPPPGHAPFSYSINTVATTHNSVYLDDPRPLFIRNFEMVLEPCSAFLDTVYVAFTVHTNTRRARRSAPYRKLHMDPILKV